MASKMSIIFDDFCRRCDLNRNFRLLALEIAEKIYKNIGLVQKYQDLVFEKRN